MAPRISTAKPTERVRRIGWFRVSGNPGMRPTLSEALRELGWVEGRNLAFEMRHAEGQRERAPALAKELVVANVELIVAEALTAIRAAMQATTEVPIVMAWWGGPDLVESGVIARYARPGGNVTGVDMLLSVLEAKRPDVLRQAVPKATKVAVLVHNRQDFEPQMQRQLQRSLRCHRPLAVPGATDHVQPALCPRQQADHRISRPHRRSCHPRRGPQRARRRPDRLWHDASEPRPPSARQIDKILRGAKPGDLPVEQPSRYEMAINLSTAKSLGLVIPQALLLQADQLIE